MADSIQDQINTMMSSMGVSNDPEPTPSGEPGPGSDEPPGDKGTPKEEPVQTPTDEGGDQNEPPKGSEVPSDDSGGGEPENDLEALKRENDELRARISEVLQQNQQPQKTEEPKLSLGDFDPIGDSDVEDIIETPETFKKWASNAFQTFGQKLLESLSQELPNVVKTQASETVNYYQKANEFYDNNKDLKNYKPYVAFKMQQLVAQEGKDKPLDEILSKTAEEVRKDLKLSAPKPQDSPALPKRGARSSARSKRKEPELSGVEKEIAEMTEALDR
jgi:hypothetical protein